MTLAAFQDGLDCPGSAAKVFAMTANARNTLVVFVMAGKKAEAETIARALVNEQLAACANIVGSVRSIYRWRGGVEEAREHLIMIKTRKALYPTLERRVRELHSYEVPEILALGPFTGSPAYLDWILDSTICAHNPRRRTARQT
jgi:periplasmic divalent cation tolerance protein